MTFLDWVSLRKFFDGLIYQQCGDNKGSGCVTENRKGPALEASALWTCWLECPLPRDSLSDLLMEFEQCDIRGWVWSSDKDSKYLIVAVAFCMERLYRNQKEAQAPQLRILLWIPLFWPWFLDRMQRWVDSTHREGGKAGTHRPS